MELTKKIFNIATITKIKYKNDAIIVYTKDKVYICAINSEKYLSNDIVEYTLKELNKRDKGNEYRQYKK